MKKEGKWKKRRKKNRMKKKAKCKKSTRTRWWSKIRKSFVSAFTRKRKEEEEEKKCRSKARYPKERQGLGRWGRWLLLLLLLGQSMLGVSALKVHRGENQWSSERKEKCNLKRKDERNLFLTGGRSQEEWIQQT